VGGALFIGAGWGPLSTAYAGLALTGAGLVLFALTVLRHPARD
jgi:DHA1 family inner membrane transport protein